MLAALRNKRFSLTGTPFVVSTTGDPVYFPLLPAQVRPDALLPLPVWREPRGTFSFDLAGRTYFCVYEHDGPWNWIVGLALPVDRMFHERDGYLWLVSLISGSMLLASLLLSYLFARELVRGIDTALLCVRRVEAGDLNARIALVYGDRDELGALQQGINSMAATLQLRTWEQSETEAALRASHDRFRSLVEATSDLIWEVDPDGTYTYVSPKIRELLGYEPEEVIGRTVFDLLVPLEAEPVRETFRRIVASRQPFEHLENINLHKHGRLVFIETGGVPVFAENGELIGYRGVDRDITERKRAEDELRRLRNMLSNIINSMPSVLISVDRDGRVVQWNREAERMTGVTAVEAQGQLLGEVYPQLLVQMERVRRAVRERDPQRDTKVASLRDGELRYADITVYPLVANGVEGAVIRVDDITERVRIEEMMIQSEKMLSVGGLAAGMAHEINNPLAGILQNAQVLRNRLLGDLPKNRAVAQECGMTLEALAAYAEKRGITSMLEAIIESGRRAARIVDNMLSFSRKSEAKFESHDLAQLLDRTLELAANDYDLKKHYDFRRIEIVREYAPDMPVVRCEASKIQQVLLNLLKNGAQAMVENRVAGVSPRFVLRTLVEGDMARVEIEDNGPGMPESIRKRVFEPFFTTKGVGTGLGLSVSYFIITENHKGTLSVESKPGQGTRFIIRLPIKGPGG
jgi:PAS domain S-box-containing protein